MNQCPDKIGIGFRHQVIGSQQAQHGGRQALRIGARLFGRRQLIHRVHVAVLHQRQALFGGKVRGAAADQHGRLHGGGVFKACLHKISAIGLRGRQAFLIGQHHGHGAAIAAFYHAIRPHNGGAGAGQGACFHFLRAQHNGDIAHLALPFWLRAIARLQLLGEVGVFIEGVGTM